jgi:hypothetical protein
MAPYKTSTAPCLLASLFLTEFVPRHGGPDVAQDGVTSLGVVPCTYDAKGSDTLVWVHFCNYFPQRSICKTLTKKTKMQKIYVSSPPPLQVATTIYTYITRDGNGYRKPENPTGFTR